MASNIRVLLVEDSNDDAELVYRELSRRGFEPALRCVDTRADVEKALRESAWDIVIADYRLPGFNALTVIDEARSLETPVPVIMISGAVDDFSTLAALRKGAVDYVPKDRLELLGEAVEKALDPGRNT